MSCHFSFAIPFSLPLWGEYIKVVSILLDSSRLGLCAVLVIIELIFGQFRQIIASYGYDAAADADADDQP